jgi:hypothetical protein
MHLIILKAFLICPITFESFRLRETVFIEAFSRVEGKMKLFNIAGVGGTTLL